MFCRSASAGDRSFVSVDNRSVVSVSSQSSSSSRSRSRKSFITRIYGPRNLEDEFVLGDLEKESRPVLAKIEKCYSRVKNPELRSGGLCFGLLDPTSNIYVNSYMSPDVATWVREGQQAPDMIQRSLNGLLAFLTRLFPHLPDVEALRYLDAAGADPLLASLLIIHRRGIEQSFRIDSDATVATVEAALRCAAVAAQHPDPGTLVLGWKVVSPDLKEILHSLQFNRDVLRVREAKMKAPGASELGLQLKESWELAKSRLHLAKPQALPFARAARKRVLIATIHRFYLQALARLPKDELCARYHQSLLKAGHCYGPLDPVSNIIFNTLWYDKAFPPSKQVTIHMISTKSLMRIVARSFYGLVSFMCTRYPNRTADQVLECLQVANADLRVADPALGDITAGRRDVSQSFSGNLTQVASFRALGYEAVGRHNPLPSLDLAYAAAAAAAGHPKPYEQQILLGSRDSLLKLEVAHIQHLHKNCILSSQCAEFLASLLVSPSSDESHQQPQPEPRKVDKAAYSEFSHQCLKFWRQHARVLRMVERALAKFNINAVHKFRLHCICGVNELVSGPQYRPGVQPYIYHHTHINFLATREDPESAHAPASLFFAECGNYNTNESWCIPVDLVDQDTGHLRCIYCECQGTTSIVHPAAQGFHGRDIEFEKVLRGETLFDKSGLSWYTNNSLFVGNAPDKLQSPLADDFIYFDYVPDPNARRIVDIEDAYMFEK